MKIKLSLTREIDIDPDVIAAGLKYGASSGDVEDAISACVEAAVLRVLRTGKLSEVTLDGFNSLHATAWARFRRLEAAHEGRAVDRLPRTVVLPDRLASDQAETTPWILDGETYDVPPESWDDGIGVASGAGE